MAEQDDRIGRSPETTRIGDYEVLNRLSKGGRGTGFKARQLSTGRLVVLRILLPQLAGDEDFRKRFLREARAAAKLTHPNIAQGIDVGRAEGFYYSATEFVEGTTVAELIRSEGPIAEARALEIVGAVALALEHALAHDVIHRDIAPETIVIDREGVVKLTGLGVARPPDEPGSPHYVAPEAARGETELDTRTDIYALGATLYHMLAGDVPFHAPTDAAIMAKHIAEPVPSLAEKNPELSRGVCDLVERMMAKERDQRPQSPRALLDAIHDVLEGRERPLPAVAAPEVPVAAPEEEPAPAPEAARGRPRVLPWVGMGVLALVLVCIGLFLALRRPASPKLEDRLDRLAEAKAAYETALKAWEEEPDDLEGAIRRFRAVRTTYAGTEPAGLAAAKLQELERKKLDQAKAAYEAALQKWQGKPEELDEALAQFNDVRSKYAGTEWAERAAAKVEELELNKAELAARTEAQRKVARQLGKLRAECRPLLQRRLFGQAVERVEAFASQHISDGGAEEAAKLRREILAKADQRYNGVARAADAAVRKKDYARARAAVQPALSFGIPALARQAKKKLADIDSREKHAELWAKWDEAKAEARKLAQEGKYNEAIRRLQSAQKLPLPGAARRIADEAKAIEAIRRKAVDAAVAAYRKDSEKVWALFKKREYAEADKAIADLKSKPAYALAVVHVAADAEALKLLEEFWAAVGRGLAARKGQFLAFGGVGGKIVSVENGMVTVKGPKGTAGRHVHRLGAGQAAAYADLKEAPRAKLIKGVFLLAEGHNLDGAERALATAGDESCVRIYRDRLAAAMGWEKLFDGKSLAGWRVVKEGQFARPGKVGVDSGRIVLERGDPRTGIATTREVPTVDYEISLDAMRVAGDDDLCNIVFPVGRSHCCLAVGGWGGRVVALTSVDGRSGANNPTTRRMDFERGRWYGVRLRVTQARIEAWIDEQEVIEIERAGHQFALWDGHVPLKPLGVYSWGTTAALRSIMLRRLEGTPRAVVEKKPEKAPARPRPGKWHDLLEGKNLRAWRPELQPETRGSPKQKVRLSRSGVFINALVGIRAGIAWTRDFPTQNYEVSLDATCLGGDGGFCGVAFPFETAQWSLTLSLVHGRGRVLLDRIRGGSGPPRGVKARKEFVPGRWYRVRIRVTERQIEVWVDSKKLSDLPPVASVDVVPYWTTDPRLFGLGAYNAQTAVRNIRVRRLAEEPKAGAEKKPTPRVPQRPRGAPGGFFE